MVYSDKFAKVNNLRRESIPFCSREVVGFSTVLTPSPWASGWSPSGGWDTSLPQTRSALAIARKVPTPASSQGTETLCQGRSRWREGVVLERKGSVLSQRTLLQVETVNCGVQGHRLPCQMTGFTPSSWLMTSVTLDKHFTSVCLSFPTCGMGMVTAHTSRWWRALESQSL